MIIILIKKMCLLFQDYHVFFMHNPSPNRCLVFDLDTTLPFPTYFHKYVTETFRSDYAVSEDHHRFFRVIPADEYLTTFSSDRRHMKRPDGSWIKVRGQLFDLMTHMMYFLIYTNFIYSIKPPPQYSPIITNVGKYQQV